MAENLEICLKLLNDENWRNISNSIVYIRCKEKLKILEKAGFEVDFRNDGFIAMCFVNHLEGLSFYVIAAAHIRNNNIFISRENKNASLIIKAEILKNCLYLNQSYMEINLTKYYLYADALRKQYELPFEEAVSIRDITELDDFRKPFYPDEIEVLFVGKTISQERVFVRAERFGDNCLYGILLDEPKNETGFHKGEEIDFILVEQNGKANTIHFVK